MRTFVMALIMAAAALPAGAPKGFEHWTSGELRGFEKKLCLKMNAQKIATQPLAGYGNHSFLVAHREGNGEAELHETQNDVMVVESGEATLVVGGTVVNPQNHRAARDSRAFDSRRRKGGAGGRRRGAHPDQDGAPDAGGERQADHLFRGEDRLGARLRELIAASAAAFRDNRV